MNLVVTGATSFLGAALVEGLLRQGHQVYAVVRPYSRNKKVLNKQTSNAKLHILEMELEELLGIRERIRVPCQVFFHLGWDGSGSTNRRKVQVQQKNVEDSIKALQGARSLGCRRFLFSGSQAEYGICRTVMREDMDCHPVSEYGKAKVEFGRQARWLCRQWREEGSCEMEYIHVRIFSVYGPGDHSWSLVNTCLDTFLNNGTMELGACTQAWNFLYIEDFVKGFLALAFDRKAEEGDGIYNLAGSEESTMSLSGYVEKMHELCGSRGTCLYGKLPPNAEGQANLIPDITKICQKTGWKPEISFEEGIKRMLEMRRNRHCILCGESLDKTQLMELEDMPSSAQDIPDAGEVEKDYGVTLRLCQCSSCGLVQFDCQPVGYYRDVIRSGGYSTTMENLRKRQYRHLIETYGLEGKKFLEAGCGSGEFLKVLSEFPVKAYGVEHRKSLVKAALDEGLNVTEGFPETADTCLGSNGPYDVFLSFNFLEHQPNPGVMLDCIWNNLADSGMGLVTVPSLEYILKYNGYYELLRDHIGYYTFDTLRYLLERHGFQVLEEELINRDTLSVIVRKKTDEIFKAQDSRKEEDVRTLKVQKLDPSDLAAGREKIRRQMEELCETCKAEEKSLAIWGASHQGFTLAATTVLKEHARYIIDSAPFKQGKFAPASHLPIVAPEWYDKEPVDVILIVAPGYTEEIAGNIRSRFGTKVKILTLRSDQVEELL